MSRMSGVATSARKALQFVGYKDRKHLGKKLEFKTWGNGGGKQGVTQGAIKGDPDGPGFAVVWSNGTEDGEPDKLYYAMVNANSSGVTWQVEPRKAPARAPCRQTRHMPLAWVDIVIADDAAPPVLHEANLWQ